MGSMENKVTFWGTLDVTARSLEEVPNPFQNLFNRGEYRMREEDVKRMESYLRRIATSLKQTRHTLSLFKSINKK